MVGHNGQVEVMAFLEPDNICSMALSLSGYVIQGNVFMVFVALGFISVCLSLLIGDGLERNRKVIAKLEETRIRG